MYLQSHFNVFCAKRIIIFLWVSAFCLFAKTVTAETISDGNNYYKTRPALISREMELIYGIWTGGDVATVATFGVMRITPEKISWKTGNSAECSTGYYFSDDHPGRVFQDQVGNKYTTTLDYGERYKTYFIEIKHIECVGAITKIRFTLDKHLPGYLAHVVHEGETNTQALRGHFFFESLTEK